MADTISPNQEGSWLRDQVLMPEHLFARLVGEDATLLDFSKLVQHQEAIAAVVLFSEWSRGIWMSSTANENPSFSDALPVRRSTHCQCVAAQICGAKCSRLSMSSCLGVLYQIGAARPLYQRSPSFTRPARSSGVSGSIGKGRGPSTQGVVVAARYAPPPPHCRDLASRPHRWGYRHWSARGNNFTEHHHLLTGRHGQGAKKRGHKERHGRAEPGDEAKSWSLAGGKVNIKASNETSNVSCKLNNAQNKIM